MAPMFQGTMYVTATGGNCLVTRAVAWQSH